MKVVSRMHNWDPEDYRRSASAQFGWAMALIESLKIKGDERILDIGCGDGRITAYLARLVPDGRVLGVDLSPDMIGFACREYAAIPNLGFQVADASRLHFREEFDLVVSFACLHWIEDHIPVLEGVRDSLIPGGRFLMQCGGKGNAEKLFYYTDRAAARDPWKPYFAGFSFPYHFYGPEEYRIWLGQASLSPIRVDLVAKDMVHQGQAGLEGIIRNTWLPYTERLPTRLQDDFVREVAGGYLKDHPLDDQGQAHVQMMRLEVEAMRPY